MESINEKEGNSTLNTNNNETSSAANGKSTLFSRLDGMVTMDDFESSGQKASDGEGNGKRKLTSPEMNQNLDATSRALLNGASQEDNSKATERMEPIVLFSSFGPTRKEAKENTGSDCSLAVGELRSGSTQSDDELAGKAMGQGTIANGSQTVASKLAGSIASLASDQSEEGIKLWSLVKSLVVQRSMSSPKQSVMTRETLPGSFVSAADMIKEMNKSERGTRGSSGTMVESEREEGKLDSNQAAKETSVVNNNNYDQALMNKRELIKAKHPDAFEVIENLESPQRSKLYQEYEMNDSDEATIVEEHIEASFNAQANNHRKHKRRAEGISSAELMPMDDAFSQHRAREIVNEAKRNGTAEGLQSAVIVRNSTPATNRSKNAGRGGRGTGQSHVTPGVETIVETDQTSTMAASVRMSTMIDGARVGAMHILINGFPCHYNVATVLKECTGLSTRNDLGIDLVDLGKRLAGDTPYRMFTRLECYDIRYDCEAQNGSHL